MTETTQTTPTETAPKTTEKATEKAKSKKTVVLIYHKPNIVSFQLDPKQPLFILKAGSNIIPADIYELMKKDSVLNGKIESGLIELVADEVKSEDPKEVYASLKPKAKRDLITNSTDEEHLKAFLETEKNEELKKLISSQLEKVSAAPDFRD